jgi:hypothetical protein
MPSFMISHVSLCSEAHIAVSKVTPKRLLPIVDAHMRYQVTLLSEGFLAVIHLANERPLSSLLIFKNEFNLRVTAGEFLVFPLLSTSSHILGTNT